MRAHASPLSFMGFFFHLWHFVYCNTLPPVNPHTSVMTFKNHSYSLSLRFTFVEGLDVPWLETIGPLESILVPQVHSFSVWINSVAWLHSRMIPATGVFMEKYWLEWWMVMVTAKGWCRWCESPPAAVIRGVLQAAILHSALIGGPRWNLTVLMKGACLCFRGGLVKEQTAQWYKLVAHGKRSTLMEVNQWLTDWRQEKSSLLCSILRDWKILLVYPLNIFCTTLTYQISSSAEVQLLTALRFLRRVFFPHHIISRWICQCFTVKLQPDASKGGYGTHFLKSTAQVGWEFYSWDLCCISKRIWYAQTPDCIIGWRNCITSSDQQRVILYLSHSSFIHSLYLLYPN